MVEQAAKGRKTRSAGRFGPRYGRKARKLVADIEGQMRQKHRCPKCGRITVVRKGTGIWRCKKCDVTFTGGTYTPYTSVGKTVMRSIKKGMEGVAATGVEINKGKEPVEKSTKPEENSKSAENGGEQKS